MVTNISFSACLDRGQGLGNVLGKCHLSGVEVGLKSP